MAETVLKRKVASKPPERFYTPEEVAEILSVTTQTVKRWIAEGRIGYIRMPKGSRIRQRHLDEFLDEREVA
jgi:excisionase family DNA binding protein